MKARVSVEQLEAALQACAGNVSKAARSLGIARNNLYKRLASPGLSPTTYRLDAAARRPVPPEPAAAEMPARQPLRRSRSFYLRPEQLRAMDEACLDLTPVLRERLSPSRVLERFMDDRFAEWVRAALATRP